MSDSSTTHEPETTSDAPSAVDATVEATETPAAEAKAADGASQATEASASPAADDSASGDDTEAIPAATPAERAAEPSAESAETATAEATASDSSAGEASAAEAPDAAVADAAVADAAVADAEASGAAPVEAKTSEAAADQAPDEAASAEPAATEAAPQDDAVASAVTEAAETPATTLETAGAPEADATPKEAKPKVAKPEVAKPEVASSPEEGGEQPKPAEATEGVVDPALDPVLAPLVVAMETKAPIEGKVIGWNKGGYHVALGQIAAFCPVSQIETGSPRAPKRYVDRTFKFVVIDVAKDGRRVVVSRADALKSERKDKAAKVRETVKVGAVFDGKIRSLTDFGAFVRIADGIEGLVHVSELSRRRVENPRELVTVGQAVKVKVLKVEKGGERISLSMKRLEADPWKTLNERLPAGSPFTGTIRRKTDFGLFVEVEPGIEGLIHTSRLPHGKTIEDESLAEGKTIEGWVQETEPRRRRLGLSLRPVPNAKVWDGVEERFPIGDVVQATVERVADFGAFIELEPGLTGLLPFSELRGEGGGGGGGINFKRQYHAGKQVSVKVLSIDVGRKRISLGTETSKAVGTDADYRHFKKQTRQATSTGLGAMASAFAKLQGN